MEAQKFAFSPETSWMDETEAGEFYEFYCDFQRDCMQAMLDCPVPLLSQSAIAKMFKPLSSKRFYKTVEEKSNEHRRDFLKRIVLGHAQMQREIHERATDLFREHPTEGSDPQIRGRLLGQAIVHGMDLKDRTKS